MGNTFENNTALGSEFSYSAFFLWDALDSEVIVDRNIFQSNQSMYAGGFYSRNSNNLRLTNNIFTDNTATSNGGAIVLYELYTKDKSGYSGDLNEEMKVSYKITKEDTLHAVYANNTFLNNQANLGGAIITNVDINYPIFLNNIFFGNTASTGTDIYNSGDLPVIVSYSDINPDNIYGAWNGEGNIDDDPIFVGSGDHPYALSAGSPCIDAGTPDTTGLNLPPFDIMGCYRFWDGDGDGIAVIDMGAYEFDSPSVGIPQSEIRNRKPEIAAYPNPFSTSITIQYELIQPSTVQLTIYDYMGKQVAVMKKSQAQGKQQIVWNAEGLPAGVYFCVIKTNQGIQNTKLIKL